MHSFCRALPTRQQSLIGVFARILRQCVGLRMMVIWLWCRWWWQLLSWQWQCNFFSMRMGAEASYIHSAAALVVHIFAWKEFAIFSFRFFPIFVRWSHTEMFLVHIWKPISEKIMVLLLPSTNLEKWSDTGKSFQCLAGSEIILLTNFEKWSHSQKRKDSREHITLRYLYIQGILVILYSSHSIQNIFKPIYLSIIYSSHSSHNMF